MSADPVKAAKLFWREEYFSFCCEDEDCIYDHEFIHEKSQFICEVTNEYHGSLVRLYRNGNWKRLNSGVSTPAEDLFWYHLAKCFSQLPEWYLLPNLDLETIDTTCQCPTKTLVSIGCQCGGS